MHGRAESGAACITTRAAGTTTRESGYRTCAATGKAGGNITMSVTVQIIGTGSATLAGAIYDFGIRLPLQLRFR
jgi:hypothetical protein